MLEIRNDFTRDVAARDRHHRAEPTRARQRTRSGDARRTRPRIRRACRGRRHPAAVLRGSGKHFCAGADLADRTRAESGAGPTLFDVLEAIDRLPKPTIAAVHGGAIAGGAAIAACCDVVVATDAAFFSIPEVRVGMAPVRLAPIFIRAMGHRNFRRYGISGERMDAAEALRVGLVHQLCTSQQLDAAIADVADALLHGAPGAIRELKSACAGLAMPPWPAGSAGCGQLLM
jgi:methylglutaconyl-CoA hydratase